MSILTPPPAPGFRVLIAEPLPLLGGLLADLVRAQPGVVLVGKVTTVGDLVAETGRLNPHLVVLDWALGGPPSLCALRALDPPPEVLVIAATVDSALAGLVQQQGGTGCLDRAQSAAHLPLHLAQARTRDQAARTSAPG
jgi:DNA-binding NarL/FixJ family response regulator